MTDQYIVTLKENGHRFDVACASLIPQYSRSMLTQGIRKGQILLNHTKILPKKIVATGDVIEVHQAFIQTPNDPTNWQGTAIELNIVYEDQHIIVINKPKDLVVHPCAAHLTDTVANGLINKIEGQAKLPRAGIVHRLDKDTTGLMVAAKTLQAHQSLTTQIKSRSVERIYSAIVFGYIQPNIGTIDDPMRRSSKNRLKQAIDLDGKVAITHYKTLKKFEGLSHVECKLDTGRTHQIRVHMLHIGHPIVGDPLYKKQHALAKITDLNHQKNIQQLARQALHAKRLRFFHPQTNQPLSFRAVIPDDMQAILNN